MKLFISWSEEASHKAALSLKKYIKSVIQAVDPYVSSEDIEKGAQWFTKLMIQLNQTDFGVLCLTPCNLNTPWILFEAGALSNKLDQSHVSPLLIGLSKTDLRPPLSLFNATSSTEEDICKLLLTINKKLKDKALEETLLKESFKMWWPQLKKELDEATELAKKESLKTDTVPKRTPEDMLEEVLNLSRSTAKQLNNHVLRNDQSKWISTLIKRKNRSIREAVPEEMLRAYLNMPKPEDSEQSIYNLASWEIDKMKKNTKNMSEEDE